MSRYSDYLARSFWLLFWSHSSLASGLLFITAFRRYSYVLKLIYFGCNCRCRAFILGKPQNEAKRLPSLIFLYPLYARSLKSSNCFSAVHSCSGSQSQVHMPGPFLIGYLTYIDAQPQAVI